MAHKNTYDTQPKGLLSGINELGPRQAKAAAVGILAVGALLGGSYKMAERLGEVANPHQVPKTEVVHNARDPRAGFSQVTTTTEFTGQEIGGK
jgi:hypothetical protein